MAISLAMKVLGYPVPIFPMGWCMSVHGDHLATRIRNQMKTSLHQRLATKTTCSVRLTGGVNAKTIWNCEETGAYPSTLLRMHLMMSAASRACAESYGAFLPSVSTKQESNNLRNFFYETLENSSDMFYIGLECSQDGRWMWDNQESWSGDYAPFVARENTSTCDPGANHHYFLNIYGQWVPLRSRSSCIICGVRPIGYNQPPPTTTEQTTAPSTIWTTEAASAATTRDETTAASSTASTTTSSIIETEDEEPSIESTSTAPLTVPEPTSSITKDTSSGFPAWAIILIILVVILLLVIAVKIMYWSRRKKIESMEFNDTMKKNIETTKKTNRYYAHSIIAPIKFDEWEIERKYVGIDYSHKLGEGAFGCVYMGRILFKNLPTPAWKSMVTLAAVRSNNDTVAVKMLHESADISALIEFRSEIERMKRIGPCLQSKSPMDSLCRSIGRETEHYHSLGGKLPLKWMPPEAIEQFEFSAASDVWSYGVLLFEIITLGGAPNAGWPAAELLSRLKQGERMSRPDNCNDCLYQLMSHCWLESPSERPGISAIRQQLGMLLDDASEDYYVKLNYQANYYALESTGSH